MDAELKMQNFGGFLWIHFHSQRFLSPVDETVLWGKMFRQASWTGGNCSSLAKLARYECIVCLKSSSDSCISSSHSYLILWLRIPGKWKAKYPLLICQLWMMQPVSLFYSSYAAQNRLYQRIHADEPERGLCLLLAMIVLLHCIAGSWESQSESPTLKNQVPAPTSWKKPFLSWQ